MDNWSGISTCMPEKSGIVGQDNLLGQFQGVLLIRILQGHFLHLVEYPLLFEQLFELNSSPQVLGFVNFHISGPPSSSDQG